MNDEIVEIPLERVDPDILRKMIEEFVTREWRGDVDSDCSLDQKVAQVRQQLQDKRARIVYEVTSETWNIIPAR